MKIRECRPEDVETLFEIRTSVSENYMSREALATEGINSQTVAEMIQTNYKAWVVEIEGKVIGFSIVYPRENSIYTLFVLPDFQGRGVGKILMEESENWLWMQGAEEIQLLTANNTNFRSFGFYLHLGWTPTNIQPDGQIKFIKNIKNRTH